MTALIIDTLSTFAWKGALLLLVCQAAVGISRGPAASRAHVLELAFAGLALLPLGVLLLPEWRVAVPIEVATGDSTPAVHTEGMASDLPLNITPAALAPPSGTNPTSRRSAVDSRPMIAPSTILLSLWAIGALLILGRLALGRRWSARLRRAASPADPVACRMAERLRDTFGITRPVRVIESGRATVPGTFGTRRPVIVLPAASRTWSEERLRAVLLHELAHVARLDAARQTLSRVALSLHWFNPLAWSAQRRWRLERERACDDQVLARGVRASDYATHLVEIAATGSPLAAMPLAMSERSLLETRVVALLEEAPPHTTVSRRMKMFRTMTFLAVLLPLSAVALSPQEAPTTEEGTVDSETVEEAPSLIAVPVRAEHAALDLLMAERFDPRNTTIGIGGGAGGAVGIRSDRSIGLEEILELQNRGVTPEWLREMRRVLDTPSVEVLVQLHDHGITPEFVTAALVARHGEIDLEQLIELSVTRVDPERLGYEGFSNDELLELRRHGITPEFHRAMIQALGQRPSVEELMTLHSKGISPEVAGEYTNTYRVSVEEIANAVAHGVSVEYSRQMKRLLPALELDDLIELAQHGVRPELVEAAVGQDDPASIRVRRTPRRLDK